MSDYHIRPATLDDIDALVRHRLAMFTDMGTTFDAAAVDAAFRRWVAEMMPAGVYRAWLVEDHGPPDRLRQGYGGPPKREDLGSRAKAEAGPHENIVAGGGITILPWPPGPYFVGGRVAFVYNVYTERSHRRRGLARMIMNAIHAWCRAEGLRIVGLHASEDGRPLYESLGYQVRGGPMMWVGLD